MAEDMNEKIGARSPKNCHVLEYKNPLKNIVFTKCPRETNCPALKLELVIYEQNII